jgi:hypothetical protein
MYETRSFYGAAAADVLASLEEELGTPVYLSCDLRILDRRLFRDYRLAAWVEAEGTPTGVIDLREERLTMPLSLGDELDLLVEMSNSLASRFNSLKAWRAEEAARKGQPATS